MKKLKKPVNSLGNILIYDDENIKYYSGVPFSIDFEHETMTYNCSDSDYSRTISIGVNLNVRLNNYEESNNIKLDDTLMRRIAKFNKEQDIKKLDEVIKEKKEKIKELDDILQDKEKRVDKLKKFVANIYDIDIDNDDEYDDEEYYD